MLTIEQKACNDETWKHIHLVQNNIYKMIRRLLFRAENHDQSKLKSPEVELFTEFTPSLSKTTYGSPEYEEGKKKLGPALEHHFRYNTHHPEHYPNGVDGMDLIDVVEMFCDWYASTKRHDDGDINTSIDINTKRYNLSPQLVNIFKNTVMWMEN